ncbi:MAG: LysM peptidoglycan-binding domain-containing protein [Bacteroidales bacterium]|nr:LysM peptidoglycan-binding domain-containing protein [Bacteroidales bacterium]
MKLFSKTLIILSVFIFGFTAVYGQTDLESKRSKSMVTIEGLSYYIHFVTDNQTLSDINKIYNIPVEIIIAENPTASKGIFSGMTLKIPYVNVNESFKKEDRIYIIVKPKETLFSLSRQYQVSVDQIKKANNLTENALNINQYLVIPILQDKIDAKYIYHTIRPNESLDDLQTKFGVKGKTIKKLNKDIIKEHGYKAGIVLRIPLTEEMEQSIKDDAAARVDTNVLADSVELVKIPDGCIDDKLLANNAEYKVVVFMPFYLDSNFPSDTVVVDPDNPNDPKVFGKYEINRRSEIFLDFYKGFLLSVNNMRKQGMKVNIQVYDTSKGEAALYDFMHTNDFTDVSLFVGPVDNDNLDVVAEFANFYEINLISPFRELSPKLGSSQFFFQVKNDDNYTDKAFANLLNEYKGKDVFVVYDSVADSVIIKKMKLVKPNYVYDTLNINALGVDSTIATTTFPEYRVRYLDYANYKQTKADTIHPLEALLVPYLENIVFVPSTNPGFVSEIVSKYSSFNAFNHPTKLVGPSNWLFQKAFKSFDVNLLYILEYRTLISNYIDYEKPDVKSFVYDYRGFFKEEPTKFAFHGYDVGVYFLNAIYNYGKDFASCLPDNDAVLLRNKFNFIKNDSLPGYVNVGLFDLRYQKDYTILNK